MTLLTLQRAAAMLGRKVNLELVQRFQCRSQTPVASLRLDQPPRCGLDRRFYPGGGTELFAGVVDVEVDGPL